MKLPIPIIEARGSHRRIGETIGEALRTDLQRRWQAAGGVVPDAVTRGQIRDRLAAAERHMPEVLEQIRGVERGAGVPDGWLLGEWAGPGRRSMFPDACSNIVFGHGPDGPLWGKNNDGEAPATGLPPAGGRYVILRICPDDGIPLINCTSAGWVAAGDMLNAEGLAAGFASGGSLFAQSPLHVPDRLWLYAGMLRSRTVAEYARHVTALPLRGKGFTGVVVDRHGGMLGIEIMPPLVQLRPPEPAAHGIACTNCYQLPRLRTLSGRRDVAPAECRNAYLQECCAADDMDTGRLQAILRHHGPPDICRHGAERGDYGFTEWSMIGLPRAAKVLFCWGNPCQGRYEEIAIR